MKFDLGKLKPDNYTLNIIVWNLVPYLGVFFLNWEPLTVFACYAFETIAIGFFNVFKLILVYYYGQPEQEGQGPGDLGLGTIPVFITSYGLLVYVQLMLFFSISGLVRQDSVENTMQYSIGLIMDNRTIYIALAIFFSSNGSVFIYDFILKRRYATRTMNEQMAEPFPRVLVSQLVVFIAIFLYNMFGGIMILLCLTFFKIIFELFLKRHKAIEIFGWGTQ